MKKTEIFVLVLYTAINLKILWPFIFEEGISLDVAFQQGGQESLIAVFGSLFLNATLWIYCLRKKENI